ncbi:MAG: phosphotransferase enzyme family protein [Planctomycetaceae bacterium]
MDRSSTPTEGAPIAEQDAAVRDVLRRFPIDPAEVRMESVPHALGFSGAVIRRVSVERREAAPILPDRIPAVFCLRGWPPKSLPHQRIIELHRFQHFLDAAGLHVIPVPIASVRGETLMLRDGRFWQLEPWMPGVAGFRCSATDARLQSAMKVLASLHLAAARFEPTAAGRPWFAGLLTAPSPAVRERLALMQDWTDQRLNHAHKCIGHAGDSQFAPLAGEIINHFRSLRQQGIEELLGMSRVAVPLQVCLRDVWHDHLLFTDDELTGLVDLSAARTENVAADLSRLLGSLFGKWSDRWDTALEIYGRMRPLSAQERQLVRVLHRSGTLLSGMAWIERQINGDIAPEMLPRAVKRLEWIRGQWD